MTRSNRQLTQFAVNKLRSQLNRLEPGTVSAGNTEVSVCACDCGRPPNVIIRLFGKEIMRLSLSPVNRDKVSTAWVKTGDFYDSKNRPSRTTRERLNGLLDALGEDGFIPQGVRVFFTEEGECVVGKGGQCLPLDKRSPEACILSHPSELVFS